MGPQASHTQGTSPRVAGDTGDAVRIQMPPLPPTPGNRRSSHGANPTQKLGANLGDPVPPLFSRVECWTLRLTHTRMELWPLSHTLSPYLKQDLLRC